MLYALDAAGNLIEPSPGAIGNCSLCKLPLVPKCGSINIWHWSHRAGDCDPWNEGETDWHRSWKRRADPSWCEVVLPPHRADIRRPDGLVIELQFSSISAQEIAAREAFYGNMWWLFHRDRMGKRGRFLIREERAIRFRWLSGSRTLPSVKKPFFCDLGGPVVEFTAPLDRAGGHGRLLTRGEFLAKTGLAPLTEVEKNVHSHYEVRWSQSGSGLKGNVGVIVQSDEEMEWWRGRHSKEICEVRDYRLGDSYTLVA